MILITDGLGRRIISSAGHDPKMTDALRGVYDIPEGMHIAYEPEFKELNDFYWERPLGRNGMRVDGRKSGKSLGKHVR